MKRREFSVGAAMLATPAFARGQSSGHWPGNRPFDKPTEIIARVEKLGARGVATIRIADPNASVGNLGAFAREVMPHFGTYPAVAAAT